MWWHKNISNLWEISLWSNLAVILRIKWNYYTKWAILSPFLKTDWRTAAVVTTFQSTMDRLLIHHTWEQCATTAVRYLSTPLPSTWLCASGLMVRWSAEDSMQSSWALCQQAQVSYNRVKRRDKRLRIDVCVLNVLLPVHHFISREDPLILHSVWWCNRQPGKWSLNSADIYQPGSILKDDIRCIMGNVGCNSFDSCNDSCQLYGSAKRSLQHQVRQLYGSPSATILNIRLPSSVW